MTMKPTSDRVHFEILSHTGDIKIRAYGWTLQELFLHAMQGMFQSVKPRIIANAVATERSVTLDAPSRDMLLIDFLSECLYLSDIYNEVYFAMIVDTISPTSLTATLHGTPISGFEIVEIKAVTYHDFSIKEINGQLQATIVFDI